MEKTNADNITKTVFKKNVGQSYIQLQYNKNPKKNNDVSQTDLIVEIDKQVDSGSAVLLRDYIPNKRMITLKKEGHLYIVSENKGFFACFCTGRRTEFVSLQNRLLTARRGQMGEVLQCVNFDTASVEIKCSDNKLKIKIKSEDKSKEKELLFQSPQNQNINDWFQLIQKAVKQSMGSQYKLNYLTTVPKYWEILSIPERDFNMKCNSGDIILFRSTHNMAKFQRGFTGADYDHIAVVLRNSKDEILLFQSNSDTGVAITFWKDVVRFKWYEGAQRITYRPLLNVERNEEFLNTLQGFVADNLDKKFSIGIGKLMKFTSKFATKQQQKDRTYFCSELIAKCYKQLGLLEPNKSSTQYWPGDFSESKYLPLLKGQLGPEQLICFDRQICKRK